MPDSNVWISWLRGTSRAVTERLRQETLEGRVRFCSMVKAELIYGQLNSDRAKSNEPQLAQAFSLLPSLPFDDSCCQAYAALRTYLEKRGEKIGRNDLIIAAIALANDVILVSHNTREFSRVPDLKLEDWQTDAPKRREET